MRRRFRTVVQLALGFAVAAALLCGVAVLVLRSNWLRNEVRLRTIAAVERASGGRVELRRFDFDWLTLSADFRGFTVHGSEPASAPPLLTAADVHISFPWTAVWHRELVISSLTVEQPRVYLLVRPDGSTNVPPPQHKQKSSFDLMRLHIGHIAVNNGVIECNDKKLPFDLRASDLGLGLSYVSKPAHYDVQLAVASIARLHSGIQVLPSNASLRMHAEVGRETVDVHDLALTSTEATLQASGTLRHFEAPIADFETHVQVQAPLLTRGVPWVSFGAGTVGLGGSLHFSPQESIRFQGRLQADKLLFRYPGGQIVDAAVTAHVLADRAGATSHDVEVRALGGHFGGGAEIHEWRTLAVHGAVENADTNRVMGALIHVQLPWSGWASGPVRLTAVFSQGDGIAVQAKLHVAPKAEGTPLTGDLAGSYLQRGNRVQFDQLSAQLPATHVEASGEINQDVALAVDSSNIAELAPLLPVVAKIAVPPWVPAFSGAAGGFKGHVTGSILAPRVDGDLAIQNFATAAQKWQAASAHVVASATGIGVSHGSLRQGNFHVGGDADIALENWTFNDRRAIHATLAFAGADVAQVWSKFSDKPLPIIRGLGSGQITLAGTLHNPQGDAQVRIDSLDAFGQTLNRLQASASLDGNRLVVPHGRIDAGPAALTFSGSYQHAADDWMKGDLAIAADTNGFPMNSLSLVQRFAPALGGRMEVHGDVRVRVSENRIEPVSADGRAAFRKLTWTGLPVGTLDVTAATRANELEAVVTGVLEPSGGEKLAATPLTGRIGVSLTAGNAMHGELAASQVDVAAIARLLPAEMAAARQVDGHVSGKITVDGSLTEPASLKTGVELSELLVHPPGQAGDFTLRNAAPVMVDFHDGTATVRDFKMSSQYGQVNVGGTVGYAGARQLHLDVNGQAGLQVFEIFDPNVTAAGAAVVSARIRGNVAQPLTDGSLQIQDGSFYLHNVPNGLTKVNGRMTFTGERATVEKLSAESGGGMVQLLGFVNFGAGHPLIYNLKGTAQNVRVRYAGAVSATGSGTLQLNGTTQNGLVTGNLSIERVVISPDADLGSIFASTSAARATPIDENDLVSGLQMDIRVESAPNLQVSTTLSQDVEADVDLQLRGSPARPLLFGSITANQGQIEVFGAKYSINRGEITFVNTVRIEPVLDLDLQTVARGITVDITVSGTLNKLNLNYRSDPPLQPKDIIALLTVGQAPSFTPNLPNVQPANNDVSALQAGANTVLGQAISPASNRLSKLFGITNIKIDPLVQGITNTPQARLTVEQQISKNVTVTYVTNLAQTSEQIFRFEWALSPQYSVVAVRDDNGEFGIDFQYKRRFK